MMVQSAGGSMLVWLMQCDRPCDRDSQWLLFGPTDEAVVASPEARPPVEPCGSVPNTEPR